MQLRGQILLGFNFLLYQMVLLMTAELVVFLALRHSSHIYVVWKPIRRFDCLLISRRKKEHTQFFTPNFDACFVCYYASAHTSAFREHAKALHFRWPSL